MARENKYFSLSNASEVAQLHRPEVTLPGVRKAKNFYVSRSDNNLTLRGDMFRYRDDVYTISPLWEDPDSGTNTDDYLNTVITTNDTNTDIYITRLSPMRAGVATPACSIYDDGTITTDGIVSVVVGSGTLWLQNVWSHAFIEFAGSTDMYRISRVDTNTSIVVEGIPPALSGETYTIYRLHDSDRALYPIHFEMFGSQYLYGATQPLEPDANDQAATSGPFYLKQQDVLTPLVQNQNTTGIVPDWKGGLVGSGINGFQKIYYGAENKFMGTNSQGYGFSSVNGQTWTNVFYDSKYREDVVLTGLPYGSKESAEVSLMYDSNLNKNLTYEERNGSTAAKWYTWKFDKDTKITQTIEPFGSCNKIATNGSTWVMPRVEHEFPKTIYYIPWAQPVISSYSMNIGVQLTGTAGTGYISNPFQKRWVDGAYVEALGKKIEIPETYSLVSYVSSEQGTTWTKYYIATDVGSVTPYIWTDHDGSNFIAVAGEKAYASADGVTWSLMGTFTKTIICFEALNSELYAVCPNELWKSVDGGASWAQKVLPTGVYFKNIDYCNSTYIATGSTSCIATSADGDTWAKVDTLLSDMPNQVVWDGAAYYFACQYGKITESTDLVTFVELASLGSNNHFMGIAYDGSSVHAAVTWGGLVSIQTGGAFTIPDYTFGSEQNNVVWVPQSLLIDSGLKSYRYLAGDNGGLAIVTTSGGDAWTIFNTGIFHSVNSIASNDNRILMVCDDGVAMWQQAGDPKNIWTEVAVHSSPNLYAVINDGWSEDGKTFTAGTSGFVVVGASGHILTSLVGTTWTDETHSWTASDLHGVCFDGTKYITVGDAGTILNTTDTTSTWVVKSPSEANDFYAVFATADLAVAVGEGGIIYISDDHGDTWTEKTSGTTANLYSVIKANNRWIAVGAAGAGRYSYDGETWNSLATNSGKDLLSVTYDDSTGFSYATGNGVVIKIPQSAAGSLFFPMSETYRAGAFTVIGGYVLLIGVSEFSNGSWTYNPRRVVWTSPGTFNDFIGYASGSQDLPGSGYLVDARTLQNNVILFESQRVAVYSFTGDIELPFTYRVISEGIYPISNPLVVDEVCYFISGQGLLYSTNGVTVDKAPGLFDLTEYVDIYDGRPVFLVFNRYTRSLLVYKYDSTAVEHRFFSINPETGAYTSIILNQPSSSNHPRALVQQVAAYAPIAQSPGGPHWIPAGAIPILLDEEYGLSRTLTLSSAVSATAIVMGIWRSTDAITWTDMSSAGLSDLFIGTTYYDGTNFIIAGYDSGTAPIGAIWTSDDDGLTWTKALDGTLSFLDIAYDGSGLYVAVGGDGGTATIYTSSDLTTWAEQTNPGVSALYSVVWSGTSWLVGGTGGQVLQSSDGIVWNEVTQSFIPNALSRVTLWGSSVVFCSEYEYGIIYTNDDGATWVSVPFPGGVGSVSGVYYDGTYYFVYGQWFYMYSTNAVTWYIVDPSIFDSKGSIENYQGMFTWNSQNYIFAGGLS